MVMRRRLATLAAVLAAGLIAYAAPARAEILIHVDKSTQQMDGSLNGAPLFTWPVSTGAPGYDTPSGTFKPFRMEKKHFSKEWDNAPMPHSIFFTMKGHAIHGSYHKTIGQPVSHGCVRLEPKNAQILFDLVKQEGMASTCVVLDGVTPGAAGGAARPRLRERHLYREWRRRRRYPAAAAHHGRLARIQRRAALLLLSRAAVLSAGAPLRL